MGKKLRCRSGYESKGQRRNCVNGVGLMRRERTALDREMNKLRAWKAGKNPWITIANHQNGPNNRPFIKVRANDYYGDPKRSFGIYSGGIAR